MATSTIASDLYVSGGLSCRTFTAPAGSITAAMIATSAGIEATKMQQQYQAMYADPVATTTATKRQVIHLVRGATGTIINFECGVAVANIGAATVSVQLRKNGSNILSAATVLDNTNTAYSNEDAAGFTSTSVVVGDVLEIDITATAGGGTLSTGFFAMLTIREDPA